MGTITDILVAVMALVVIAVCVIAGTLMISIYGPLKNTADNLEAASGSALVASDNMIDVTEDLAEVVAAAHEASSNLAEITGDMKVASDEITAISEGVSEISEEVNQATEQLTAASQKLSATVDETRESVGTVLDTLQRAGPIFGGN